MEMLKRIGISVGYALTAVLPVLFCPECKPPKTLEEAWPLIGTFAITFWGTFKSNTTIISPNRRIWTEDDRRAVLGLPPKKPQ